MVGLRRRLRLGGLSPEWERDAPPFAIVQVSVFPTPEHPLCNTPMTHYSYVLFWAFPEKCGQSMHPCIKSFDRLSLTRVPLSLPRRTPFLNFILQ